MKRCAFWPMFSLLSLAGLLGALYLAGGTTSRPFIVFQGFTNRILATGAQAAPAYEHPLTSPGLQRQGPRAPAMDAPAARAPLVARVGASHTSDDARVCSRPPTRDRTDVPTNAVYRWVDEQGQTHLSDTPPPGREAAVVDLGGRKRDFTYRIEADGATLPLSFEGEIRAGSKRIYDTWHFFLGEDKLRQSQITLRLIAGSDRYDAAAARAMSHGKPTSGYYDPVNNEAFVRYDAQRPARAVAVSFHEISHLVTASHLGPTEPWLTEGLAEYFESMEVSGQRGTIRPNAAHLRRLRNSRLPTLARFLAQDSNQWNGDQRDLNYALAWSLVHFLMRDGQGLDAIKAVIEQAHANFCRPFSASQGLSDAYPGGLRRLTQDWLDWLSGNQHGSHRI